MATSHNEYFSTHPGKSGKLKAQSVHVNKADGFFGSLAANDVAAAYGKQFSFRAGAHWGYPSAQVTETKDNSATVALAAGGLEFTTNATPTDNDDIQIRSLKTFALASGKMLKAVCRVKVDSAANLGFAFGFATSGLAELYTAAPTDGVYLMKLENAATILGRVIENGNAATDSGTLETLTDATFVRLGIEVWTDGTSVKGGFWVDDDFTGFTAAQKTDITQMLSTTAPTLSLYAGFRVNGTTQRAGTVDFILADVDR
jgi:hypothetical protein